MPELPEVETTRRGILPHILGKKIRGVVVRNNALRWPVSNKLAEYLTGQAVRAVDRRGKYLLLRFANGTLIWHLGMSGSLRVITDKQPAGKHDHVDVEFSGAVTLRYNDPRRFGTVQWTDRPLEEHSLIAHMGPEPLADVFNGEYLFTRSRKRKLAIKTWIMDSKTVVGVGNIYANESLFNAGIHPLRKTSTLTRNQCHRLAEEIKKILSRAIQKGGTTLKDFVGSDGQPGYFAQELSVYGRGRQNCNKCLKPLTEKRLGQRTTVYCVRCQK